ncbi:MAG: L,D-transpeptidase [Kiritimatiellae bacterium]|nr:L,D-transpeptidase [Kiritimatiellia bacterium]
MTVAIQVFAAFFAASFADSKTLALQIHLDRAGYSCSAIDGQWGEKSKRALERYLVDQRLFGEGGRFPGPEQAFDLLFAGASSPFRTETVTAEDLAALTSIPEDPAAKADLPRMGYETIKEMFAERGHLSQPALVKLNPGVDWAHVKAGQKIVLPDFPPMSDEFLAAERGRPNRPKRPEASLVRVSVSRCTVSAYDANGATIAHFPCSIAADKAKVPSRGELKITSCVAWPNFTYTPDHTPSGRKVRRHVWPEGENCPVGVAWMGLNLPGYGIHGTPRPESIGYTGSHGCFRLANWNAARLLAMCKPGTKVAVDP